MRALLCVALTLTLAAPAAAQLRAPYDAVAGALLDGRALVGWNQWDGDGSRAGWRATGQEVTYGPEEASRGVTGIFTTPGRGGVMVLGQTGTFAGDRYGPSYSPVRFWTVDVDPSGGTGPLRLLDEHLGGDIRDPVGWSGPDGEVLLAWYHGRRGRWVRRSPSGAWGRVRSLGRLWPSAIARDVSGRLVVTGHLTGKLVVRVGSRATSVATPRGSSSGPSLALSPGGLLVGWDVDGRAGYARLDPRGRLIGRGRFEGYASGSARVGIDRRGRGVVVAHAADRGKLRWLDRRGRTVRRQTIRPAHTGSAPSVAVSPGGDVLLATERESGGRREMAVLHGSTTSRLTDAVAPVPLARNDAWPRIAAGAADGEWLVVWRHALGDDRGEIWLQRFAGGAAAPAERVYPDA